MGRYAKAIAALLGAIGTWGVTAFEDGAATQGEWFGLLVVVGTVVGVWAVPNTESKDSAPGS